MRVRMLCSAARSAAVTGSKPPTFLFSTARAVRKKGRMVSPDALASWSTKLLKSMAVMPPALPPALCSVSLSESRSVGNHAGETRFEAAFLLRCGISTLSVFALDHLRTSILRGSHAKTAWESLPQTLIFVRRDVAYCSAVARAAAALLGRFLPRLGPLAPASGLFFGKPRNYSAAA